MAKNFFRLAFLKKKELENVGQITMGGKSPPTYGKDPEVFQRRKNYDGNQMYVFWEQLAIMGPVNQKKEAYIVGPWFVEMVCLVNVYVNCVANPQM